MARELSRSQKLEERETQAPCCRSTNNSIPNLWEAVKFWLTVGHFREGFRHGLSNPSSRRFGQLERLLCTQGSRPRSEAQTRVRRNIRPCYAGFVSPTVPTVNPEKPALPTLWVDTSVIIKMTKVERGEALQDIEVQRCTRLRDLVRGLVRNGKLLCPESDQEEEYVAQRLDDDVHRMFASLSLGISMTHRLGIQDSHIFHGMKAYAKGSATIDLPSSTYFHGDPVRRLEEVRHQRFFVSLGLTKSPEMVRRRAEAKAEVGRKWEELRLEFVAKKRTYEEQLELELHGYWGGLRELVKKFYSNIAAGRHDFWDFMGAHGALLYRTYWRELGGQPPDWDGVYKFFCSTHFTELPLPFVSCRLNANLLTGNEAIAPGDPMDVELLSVALPVAHFVLADRRMELRIKQLSLDQKCKTAVYSMSTIDGLFAELEKLK